MWNVINLIMSGGPLKGYKAYIGGVGLIVAGVAKYLTGDETLAQFATNDLPLILGGFGLVGLRNALASHMDLLKGVLDALAAVAASQNKPTTPAK